MNFLDFKKNFCILIVDDNEENVFVLQHRLQRDGFNNLLVAYNGEKALEIVKNNKVDLVLLDIRMPGISGYEVLDQLKEKIDNNEIMVLMISSSDSLESLTQCIKAGAEDFLSKPFNPEILRARIGSSIEKSWHLHTEKLYKQQIEHERSKFLEILNAVFPRSIVNEMVVSNTVKPKNIPHVAILFADVVSFTHYTEVHEPELILKNLGIFTEICESAAAKYHIEKIKMIGDAFMGTAGMLEEVDNNVMACVKWGSEVIHNLQKALPSWQIRIGIDIGDVISGIIGNRGYLFDVWGSCVNTASRIVMVAEPNCIYMTEEAWLQVKNKLKGKLAGEFSLKGKENPINLYEVELLKPVVDKPTEDTTINEDRHVVKEK